MVSTPLTVELEWTAGDFVEANKAIILARRWHFQLALALLLGYWAVQLFQAVAYGEYQADFMLLLPLLLPFVLTWAIRKGFRRSADLQGPHRFTFSDEAVDIDGPSGQTHLKWQAFNQWVETKNLFVLKETVGLTYKIIPKRAFQPEQEARFRELLVAQVKP